MLEGPKNGLKCVVWHPLEPILVSISSQSDLYFWSVTNTQNYSAFAPDFTELQDNIEYIEREDEFDEVMMTIFIIRRMNR